MNKYLEYNLINNIPILFPHKDELKYNFCPRYTIATEHNILYCFSKHKQNYRQYKYVKLNINKSFESTGNKITALFCYILTDNICNYDVNITNFEDILIWLKNNVNHHYVLITTPILQYENIYYSIANNNSLSKTFYTHYEIFNDSKIIDKLIDSNSYTICDIHNIIISLYQKSIIKKQQFLELYHTINRLSNFYYTSNIWLDLLINHRILNACDIPLLYLLRTPNKVDAQSILLYDWSVYKNLNVYMQTFYKKDILITSILSGIYPVINANTLNLILCNNISENLWINQSNISEVMRDMCNENDVFCNDFYALFAAFSCNKSMWKLWQSRKTELLQRLMVSYHNKFCTISDVLCALFNLYNIGFENMKIRKKRIHIIWKDFLDICINDKKEIQHFIEYSIPLNNRLQIPFVFLLDVYYKYDIDWTRTRYIAHNGIYKYTNLQYMICLHCNNKQNLNLYLFHKHIIQKRIYIILLCLYRKFNMFKHNYETNNYLIGYLIINFLENNKYYIT